MFGYYRNECPDVSGITVRMLQELVFGSGRNTQVNQIRGLLGEYGIVVAQGVSHIRKLLPLIIEDEKNKLTYMSKKFFNELLYELRDKDAKAKELDEDIQEICKNNLICKRLMKIEGVGMLTATAMVATVGDATIFKNGRKMAAFYFRRIFIHAKMWK